MKISYTYSLTIYDGIEKRITDVFHYDNKKRAMREFQRAKNKHQALDLKLYIEDENGDLIKQITLRSAENGKENK